MTSMKIGDQDDRVYIPGTGPKPKMTPEQKKKQEKSRQELEKSTKKHYDRLKREGKISKGKGDIKDWRKPKPPKGSKPKTKGKRQEKWRSMVKTRR